MNNIFLIIIFLIIILIIIKIKTKIKYELCIMAIFKNEEEYMEEWLIHHIKEGFDHFYLYNNDPNIEKYNYLTKYKEYITIIPWINKENIGSNSIQRQAYKHCIDTYGNDYQYILMLDLDEFIENTNNSTTKNFIKTLDKKTTKALKVQRFNYNSNGHIKKPEGGVMENYTKKEKICSSYKTMGNIDYIEKGVNFYGVHDYVYKNKNGKIYNSYLNYEKDGFPNRCEKENINEIPLVINHYYLKSYEEYLERCKLWKNGGVNRALYRKDCEKTFKKIDKEIELEN